MQKTEDNEKLEEENPPESTDEVEETTPLIEVEEPREVEESGDEEPEEGVLTKDDLLDEYEKCDNCGSFELNLKNNIYTCTNCGCRWTYEE